MSNRSKTKEERGYADGEAGNRPASSNAAYMKGYREGEKGRASSRDDLLPLEDSC